MCSGCPVLSTKLLAYLDHGRSQISRNYCRLHISRSDCGHAIINNSTLWREHSIIICIYTDFNPLPLATAMTEVHAFNVPSYLVHNFIVDIFNGKVPFQPEIPQSLKICCMLLTCSLSLKQQLMANGTS